MARHKNVDWNLPNGIPDGNGGSTHRDDDVTNSLLMDLRDELQKLNRLLHCSNFTAIPVILRTIRRNTTKRKRRIS